MYKVETYTHDRGSNMDRLVYDTSSLCEVYSELCRDMGNQAWDYAIAWSPDTGSTATIKADGTVFDNEGW